MVNVPKQVRKPVLDAARSGNPSIMDNALSRVGNLQHLEGIKMLAENSWKDVLNSRSVDILLTRIDTRMQALRAIKGSSPASEDGKIVKPTPSEVAEHGGGKGTGNGFCNTVREKLGIGRRPEPTPSVPKGGGRGAVEPLPIVVNESLPAWIGTDEAEAEGATV